MKTICRQSVAKSEVNRQSRPGEVLNESGWREDNFWPLRWWSFCNISWWRESNSDLSLFSNLFLTADGFLMWKCCRGNWSVTKWKENVRPVELQNGLASSFCLPIHTSCSREGGGDKHTWPSENYTKRIDNRFPNKTGKKNSKVLNCKIGTRQ